VTRAERPILELDEVSAAYGPYRALFGVSFSVGRGAAVALLGPNGAGKSTVARVASGLVPVSSGSVRVDGRDVTGEPAWRIARAGLAHVPEGRGVFDSLSVEENLVLSFRQRGGRGQVSASLVQAYERFPVLGERRQDRAGTLSGGQQRLLSLAKVLVAPPEVLLADELSLGLAPGVVDDVYAALADVQRKGTALVVVEQQVDRALALASSAVILEHGAVAYFGPASGALAAVKQVVERRARGRWQPARADPFDRRRGRTNAAFPGEPDPGAVTESGGGGGR
jgi:branched-chain amino acid transport system ATP-binding protein